MHGLFISLDNEGWTILLVVLCHRMFLKVRGYIKIAVFVDVVLKISS